MAPRHRGHRRRSNLRLYALMTLVCGVLALLAHFLFEAPAAVRRYAEDQVNSAVSSAVRSQVKDAASGQQLPTIPR
jgi:hypothetical protein